MKGIKAMAGMLILLIGLSIITEAKAQELDEEAQKEKARINMMFDIISDSVDDLIEETPLLAPFVMCIYVPIACYHIISLLRLVKPKA